MESESIFEMELKYFSTFSGIGGFELGIQQAYVEITNRKKNGGGKENTESNAQKGKGLVAKKGKATPAQRRWNGELPNWSDDPRTPHCVGYSEIDKYAVQIYQKHFPEHKNYGDIKTINASELPNFDLLVGGFPCQSFSIAGKRKGFEDTRGTLFFELARILQAKQPGLFIFENVKGLLSHDNGQTFKTIIATLVELGYCVEWQVLNSKNHGVPQNRERVFIVGHLGGTPQPKVFPIGEDEKLYNGKIESIKRQSQTEIAGTVRRNPGKADDTYITSVSPMEYKWGKTCGALRARDYKDPKAVADGTQIRRLTPTECERLQGFPDGWTEGISDSQRYKCLGNAVTVNVVSEIIKNILYE